MSRTAESSSRNLMMGKALISSEEQFQERATLVYLGALEESALLGGEGGQELGMLSQDESETSMGGHGE